MYALTHEYRIHSSIIERYTAAVEELLRSMTAVREEVLLSATTDLFREHSGFLFHITEGAFSWFRDEDICFVLEAGDICYEYEQQRSFVGRYASEFAVKADRYDIRRIEQLAYESRDFFQVWTRFLSARADWMSAHLLYSLKGEKHFTPEIKMYRAGSQIIEQGSAGDTVYTLISGHADVIVDGIKVGEILCDEIFGALAALTSLPRTASVVTTLDSMVVSIERGKFIELIENRPLTVLKMVQDMARTIVDLNKKVVEKSHIYR